MDLSQETCNAIELSDGGESQAMAKGMSRQVGLSTHACKIKLSLNEGWRELAVARGMLSPIELSTQCNAKLF